MSEPITDALFGVDGTESPLVRSDPSGRAGWRDISVLPPLTLPPIPSPQVTREMVAAALGDDPTAPVSQEPDAAPAQQPATAPSGSDGKTPQDSAPQNSAPRENAAPPTTPLATIIAPLPAASASQVVRKAPAAGVPGSRQWPIPERAQPSRRAGGVRRYLPTLALGSRTAAQLVDFRRRAGRGGSGLPQTRFNGGAGVFFLIALLVVGVLGYTIVMGIIGSILSFFR
ncbi:MAG: hypothetical protein JO115_04270 [Pseudonocardiales bacterium]|nr:hypothetical protein [Pseudonocardiales bacterium]